MDGMPDEVQRPEERLHAALEECLDGPLAALRQGLESRLARELAAAAAAAQNSAIESLNAAAKRIRCAPSVSDIGLTLLDAAGDYCGRAALLVHKGGSLAGWRARGFAGGDSFSAAWQRFQIPASAAPAIAQAVETREAVVSLSLPEHLSAELTGLLGAAAEERVYLFPISLRRTVISVLYADSPGAAGRIRPSALELLCLVAEASIEALSLQPAAAPRAGAGEFIEDRGDAPGAAERADHSFLAGWDALPPGEREMHLRAQRFARVLVADLQLYRAPEIREGKRMRNLYGRLKEEIDKSREVYQRKFGQSLNADYFHQELVQTLAGGQEELLGPDYPGPRIAAMFP
jgi:hypothetical protein